jgi:hypothetical protein
MDLTLKLMRIMDYDSIDAAHRAAAALSWMYSYPVARRIVRECYDYPNGVRAAQYAVQKSLESARIFFGKDWSLAIIESEPRPCLRFGGSVVYGRDTVNRADYDIRRADLRITKSIGLENNFCYLMVPRGLKRIVRHELGRYICVSIGA